MSDRMTAGQIVFGGIRLTGTGTQEGMSATNDIIEDPIYNLEVYVGRRKAWHSVNIPLIVPLLVPQRCPGMFCAE
jgi:hypothetical protein